MHYHHLIAVEAESADEAVAVVEEFLGGYEGQVWDWFEIGGRWSDALNGGDVLCAADDPVAFDEAVQASMASRASEIEGVLGCLRGSSKVLHDPFGLVDLTTGHDAAKVRQDEYMAKDAALFAELLTCDDPDDRRFSLLGHRLWKLGQLVAGYYCTDSYFYDAAAYSARRDDLDERLANDPAHQWVVSVDLHN